MQPQSHEFLDAVENAYGPEGYIIAFICLVFFCCASYAIKTLWKKIEKKDTETLAIIKAHNESMIILAEEVGKGKEDVMKILIAIKTKLENM